MVRKNPKDREKELVDIAFRQFLNSGYEKTSIRSIVGEANGKIGMFYNYFSSKEEIFEVALERYNQEYIHKVNNLIKDQTDLSFLKMLDIILSSLENSLNEYRDINQGFTDSRILVVIHNRTLKSLKPIFNELILEYINKGEIPSTEKDIELLLDFMLFGISGVIHNKSDVTLEAKKKVIINLVCKVLDISSPT